MMAKRIKKYAYAFALAALAICAILLFAACGDEREYPDDRPEFTVTFEAQEGGYISGAAVQSVKDGDYTSNVVAVPYSGYKFTGWSDDYAQPERRFRVTEDVTITAYFEELYVTVQYSAGEGGIVLGNLTQTIRADGPTDPVVAIPNNGLVFVRWSDGVTTTARSDADLTDDLSVTALFGVRINYVAGEGGNIDGEAEQDVVLGEYGKEVTAVPDAGYKFTGWSDGYSENTRSDLGSSGATVTALFDKLFTGDGTQESPYMIASYDELMGIAGFPSAHYELANDLDLSGIEHTAIFARDTEGFSGVFDGRNHIIGNLTVNSAENYPSLFGVVGSGATVKNLQVQNAHIGSLLPSDSDGEMCVGILAGEARGELINVRVDGEIDVNTTEACRLQVGGLVGCAYGNITDCVADVQITLGGTSQNDMCAYGDFGGLVGNCYANEVNGSSAAGKIYSSATALDIGDETVIIGGLMGRLVTSSAVDDAKITDCSSAVEIRIWFDADIGGLISSVSGTAKRVIISDCNSSGNIEALSCATVGGIACRVSGVYAEISGCDAEGRYVVADGRIAGIVYECANAQIEDCGAFGEYLSDSGGYVAGLCFQASNVKIIRSFSKADLTADNAYGLVFMISGTDSEISECYTNQIINAAFTACGLAFTASNTKIYNCYSLSSIIISNTDGSSTSRTLMAGLVRTTRSCEIKGCYFGGFIGGDGIVTDEQAVLAVAIGFLDNGTNVSNVFVYVYDSGRTRTVVGNISDCKSITAYSKKSDLSGITDKLNGTSGKVWSTSDGLPVLDFTRAQ